MAKPIFSVRLHEAMEKQAMTQSQLAAASGCTQSAVSDYLRGRIPSGEILVSLARALGTTAESLLGLEQMEVAESAWKSRALAAEQKLSAVKSSLLALIKGI